jgi:hypothetical protein
MKPKHMGVRGFVNCSSLGLFKVPLISFNLGDGTLHFAHLLTRTE